MGWRALEGEVPGCRKEPLTDRLIDGQTGTWGLGTPSFHTGHSAPLFLLPASPSLGPGVGPQAATVWQSVSESGRWRPDQSGGGGAPLLASHSSMPQGGGASLGLSCPRGFRMTLTRAPHPGLVSGSLSCPRPLRPPSLAESVRVKGGSRSVPYPALLQKHRGFGVLQDPPWSGQVCKLLV